MTESTFVTLATKIPLLTNRDGYNYIYLVIYIVDMNACSGI